MPYNHITNNSFSIIFMFYSLQELIDLRAAGMTVPNVLGIFDEADEDRALNEDLDDFSLSSSKNGTGGDKDRGSNASTDPVDSEEEDEEKGKPAAGAPVDKRKLAKVKRGAKGSPKPVEVVVQELAVSVVEKEEESEEEVTKTHDTLAAARVRARAAMVRARKENALLKSDIYRYVSDTAWAIFLSSPMDLSTNLSCIHIYIHTYTCNTYFIQQTGEPRRGRYPRSGSGHCVFVVSVRGRRRERVRCLGVCVRGQQH